MVKKHKTKITNIFLCVLTIELTLYNSYVVLQTYISDNRLFVFLFGILSLLLLFVSTPFVKNLNQYDMVNILISIVLLGVGIVYQELGLITVAILSVIFLFLSNEQILDAYIISQSLTLFLLFVLAIFNVIPFTSEVMDYYGQAQSSLNFGINKNLVGLLIFNFSLLPFSTLLSSKVNNTLKYLFIFLCFLLNFFIVRCRTAALASLFCIILSMYFNSRNTLKPFIRIIFTYIPIFLTVICIFLAKNYNTSSFIQMINPVFSGRIELWNRFWYSFSPTLFYQRVSMYFTSYNLGGFYTSLLPFDGFFALEILKMGFILYIVILFCMVKTIDGLIKNFSQSKIILLVLISLIFMSVTESFIVEYSSFCFLLPFCISRVDSRKILNFGENK